MTVSSLFHMVPKPCKNSHVTTLTGLFCCSYFISVCQNKISSPLFVQRKKSKYFLKGINGLIIHFYISIETRIRSSLILKLFIWTLTILTTINHALVKFCILCFSWFDGYFCLQLFCATNDHHGKESWTQEWNNNETPKVIKIRKKYYE